MSALPLRRKKLLILSAVMMALVILVAIIAANAGKDIYMSSQGYFKTCSPLPDGMVCQYCKCPNGGGGPGFGGAYCDSETKPMCVRD